MESKEQNVSGDKVKETAAQARDLAGKGIEGARRKFEEAGGVDGIKDKASGFLGSVKAGFHASEGVTGAKAFLSCFQNLWKSGVAGKVVEIVVVLLIGIGATSIGGGGEEATVEKTVQNFINSIQDPGSVKKEEDSFINLAIGDMSTMLTRSLTSHRARFKVDDLESAKLKTLTVVTVGEREAHCRLMDGDNKWFDLYLSKPEDKWLVSRYSQGE